MQPLATSVDVIPIVAATCDMECSNVDPTSIAAVAICFIPSAISSTPFLIASPTNSALTTSANVSVLFLASSMALPYSSTVVAQLSYDFSASAI